MAIVIYDGTFTGGPTSTGAAGNTTACPDVAAVGTANSWKDLSGSIWHLDSSQNLIGSPASYGTDWLVRPDAEACRDVSIEIYFTYTGTGLQFGAALRRAGTATYWISLRTTGVPAAPNQTSHYAVNAGVLSNPSDDLATGYTWISGHSYRAKFSAIGASPTVCSITVVDITAGTTAFSRTFGNDTYISAVGTAGLMGWNGMGSSAIVSRVIIRNEAGVSFTVSPTTAIASTPLTITATGSGTSWVSGATTFSVTGGTGASISGLSINNGTQVATFTLNPGSAAGPLTIANSTDAATATVTVGGSSLVITAPVVSANDTTGVTFTATISGGTAPYVATLYRNASAPFTPPGTGTSAATYSGSTLALVLRDTTPGPDPVYYRIRVVDSAGSPGNATSVVTASQTANFVRRNLAPIFIGFMGDSITVGVGGSGTTGPQYFGSYLGKARPNLPITLANQGASGTTSTNWVAGQYAAAAAAFATVIAAMSPAASAKYALIQLGTNDAKTLVTTSKATYKSNISTIANAAVAAGYTVILNAPPWIVPGSYGEWDEASNSRITSYRDALVELDNGTTIRAGYTLGPEYFNLNPSQLTDGVHPGDTGYQTLGQSWVSEFERIIFGTGTTATSIIKSGQRRRGR